MRKSKYLAASLIIGGAAVAAFLIFFGEQNTEFSFVNNTSSAEMPGADFLPQPTTKSTKAVADQIVKNFLEENPFGPISDQSGGLKSITALTPEGVVNNIIASEIEAVTQSLLNPRIDATRLLISEDLSPQAIKAYLIGRAEIIGAGADKIREANVDMQNLKTIDFGSLTSAYAFVLERLYRLTVPDSLLFIHNEQMRLIAIQKSIFEALLNYEQEPLAAMVAISIFEKISDDSQALGRAITDFILANKIPIS